MIKAMEKVDKKYGWEIGSSLKHEQYVTYDEANKIYREYEYALKRLNTIIEGKDKEIERLQTNIDVMKRALRWSEWEEDGDG